ncbi:unnamed protein product, partial [Enterobius vermicularis]|uniref:Neur_chan_LBD domain-containing protein n=1 Tax=Enterobius vermicularis TaxID=51028 RepID=A0A0N4VFW6_ENTVE
ISKKKGSFFFFLDIISVFNVCCLVSEFYATSKRLTKYLMEKHNCNTPPENKVEVLYEIEVVHILSIEEIKNTMSVLVYIEERWYDKSLSWDPKQFSMLNTTWLPTDIIWVPDIIVFNMLEHTELLRSVRAPAQVDYTGLVKWSYPAIYTVMCAIYVHYFPFDEQKCYLEIASWGYDENKLRLNASSKQLLVHYTSNDEWALKYVGLKKSQFVHEDVAVSEIKLMIKVLRKPLYYMVSLVVPSYIISILSIAGLFAIFSTTNERQERFTLGVTATLTMAVLSLVVSEKTPHSSEQIPLLIWYFIYNVLVITIATISTSISMIIHSKGFAYSSKMPPKWALALFFIRESWFRKQVTYQNWYFKYF